MNKFAILVLLFTAVFAKTIAPVTEEDIVLEASVEDFLKCVHEAEPVVKDVVKEGDEIVVKYIGTDNKGRLNFSRKDAM